MSELAGSLLQVSMFEGGSKSRKGFPLMMEFRVNPELSPFLVSSSKATLWVRDHHGRVRAAVRDEKDLGRYFREVVHALIQKGSEMEWGNVQPLTKKGVLAAVEYVRSYDLTDVEILYNPAIDWTRFDVEWQVGDREIPLALFGVPLQPAVWLPPDMMVVVPKDRAYVGFLLLFQERFVSVVHNGARGVAIATGHPVEAEHGEVASEGPATEQGDT